MSALSNAKLLRNYRSAFALLLFLSWACADPRTVVLQRAFIQCWIHFLAGEGMTQHLGNKTYCEAPTRLWHNCHPEYRRRRLRCPPIARLPQYPAKRRKNATARERRQG
jgi:hypothetical protein